MALPFDITVAGLIDKNTLAKPDPYLCGILRNMWDWKKVHGSAFVNLGTTGRGVAPHYRVGPNFAELGTDIKDPDDLQEWIEKSSEDYAMLCRPFNGSSHNPLAVGDLRTLHWSSSQTSYEEVQRLIGKIRADKKRSI